MERKPKLIDLLYLLIPAGAIGLDLWTKSLVIKNLKFGQPLEILGNFLRFTFIYNEGITFGMFSGVENTAKPFILTGMALLSLAFVIYFYLQLPKYLKEGKPQVWGKVCLMFIMGGAFGNIIDRMFLFNPPGKMAVVDFLDVGIGNLRWYTFNVADSFVVVGTIILAILFIFFEKKMAKPEVEQVASDTGSKSNDSQGEDK